MEDSKQASGAEEQWARVKENGKVGRGQIP